VSLRSNAASTNPFLASTRPARPPVPSQLPALLLLALLPRNFNEACFFWENKSIIVAVDVKRGDASECQRQIQRGQQCDAL